MPKVSHRPGRFGGERTGRNREIQQVIERKGTQSCQRPGAAVRAAKHLSQQKRIGRRQSAPPVNMQRSLLVDEVAATVLLPARLVAFCAERFFFAVTDGLDTAGANGGGGQSSLHRAGTLVAQAQVVLGRSALVAVAFNRDAHVGMLIEERSIGLNGR